MSAMPMLPQFTPDMYVQAGLNPNRPIAAVGYIPITQEDRDRLGEERNKKLKTMKPMALATLVISGVAIVIGISSILVSAPYYNFPFSFGAGCISGFFGLCSALICLKIVQEGAKTPTGDETTSCMKSMLTLLIFVATFGVVTSIIAMGFGGLWGLGDCLKEPGDFREYERDNCIPNKHGNTVLAVMTIIICTLTPIMIVTMSCLYCCSRRAFGLKSGYELLMDIQSARMMEMQRVQAAQQAQIMATQPSQPQTGYYPGYYGPPTPDQMSHQHGRSPSAPPAPTDGYRHQNIDESFDAPPPAYSDVMKR